MVSVGVYCGKLTSRPQFRVRQGGELKTLSEIENDFWLYALGPKTPAEMVAHANNFERSKTKSILDSLFVADLMVPYPESNEEWRDFMLDYRLSPIAFGLGCPGADPTVYAIVGGTTGLVVTVGNLTHTIWTLSDGRALAEAAQMACDEFQVSPTEVLAQLRRDIPLLMGNGMTFLDEVVAL